MRSKTSHCPTASTFVLAGAALLSSMFGARSETYDPHEQRGRTFAQANCAMCHAVGRTGDSPLKIAPPFRTLHERYPVENLAESLAEGIVTGHPTMPQFQLDSDQIGDLIAYLKALER
jgi:cytochrome c